MDRKTITEAVAGAWCHPKNRHKVMDVDLANVIIDNVCTAAEKEEANVREPEPDHVQDVRSKG